MGWQDTERKLLEELKQDPDPRAQARLKWLEKNVLLGIDDVDAMDAPRLRLVFPGKPKDTPDGGKLATVNDAAVLRALVWQAYCKVLIGEIRPLYGNLRSFWYQHFEPFLRRVGIMEDDAGPAEVAHHTNVLWSYGVELPLSAGGNEGGREGYLLNKMGQTFDNFVLEGVFRFKEPFHFVDPRAGWRVIGRHSPGVIMFTEKEGLYGFFRDLARVLGITVIASHGEPGALNMEYFAEELAAHGIRNLYLGACNDYDPWGMDIGNKAADKLAKLEYGFRVNLEHLTTARLFTPMAIERGHRDLSRMESKRHQVEEWVKATGGIDGKPWAMHLDLALPQDIKKAVFSWYHRVTGKKPPRIGRRALEDLRRWGFE